MGFLKIKIFDGWGKGNKLKVTSEGAVLSNELPYPPPISDKFTIPFREYFTDVTGSNDMQVTTDTIFSIDADENFDIYIKSTNVTIADAGAALNKFGAVTALSNGVKLIWRSTTHGDVVIHDALKSNWDFIRLAEGQPAFGTAADSFRAKNVNGNSEGYIPSIDFTDVFGMEWGIPLRAGTNDKLLFHVLDTTTGVDQFDAIAYGIKI